MSEQEVIQLMASSLSEAHWNENCDKVKAEHGGEYPRFWYSAIVLSGLANRVLSGFGSSPGLKIQQF